MGNPPGRPRGQRKHGTRGGYQQHVRNKTEPCAPCTAANRIACNADYQRGRCAPGLGWPLEARRDG